MKKANNMVKGAAELQRVAALVNHDEPVGLYIQDGKSITTHSMIKTMLRCPKQTQYKYAERLKKRVITVRDKPLKRGTWIHE